MLVSGLFLGDGTRLQKEGYIDFYTLLHAERFISRQVSPLARSRLNFVIMRPNLDSLAPANASALQRIRTLAQLLDNAIPIPGTPYRIGLDPIMGMIPGGGDVVGLFLSAYLVLECLRFRLPTETLFRMVGNLALDGILGLLPGMGDFFDAVWKSNARNLALLEAHLANPDDSRAADRQTVTLIAIAVVAIVGGITLLMASILRALLVALGLVA